MDTPIKAYIFAGGKNERWESPISKEIVEVDGIPLIVRTHRLMMALDINPVVVSEKEDVLRVAYNASIFTQGSIGKTLCETVRSREWGKRNIVLLGDVYYTQEAIDRIFSIYNFAYGNEVELFALRWTNIESEDVMTAFDNAVLNARFHGGRGKLWEAFRALSGFPMSQHKIGRLLTLIEDDTTDFDTVEQYKEWMLINGKNDIMVL